MNWSRSLIRNEHDSEADVAARLVRWALVKDYGKKMPYRSPEYKSSAFGAGSVTVTFDCFGSTLRAFDVPEVRGFAVCGEDRVWHWATGKVVGKDSVELACAAVPQPIAVARRNRTKMTPLRTESCRCAMMNRMIAI